MAVTARALTGSRSLDRSPAAARFGDPAFRGTLRAMSAVVVALIAIFFAFLAREAAPAFGHVGIIGFTAGGRWDPAHGVFGALPLLAGTLVTSALALMLAVPVAVAAALYLTELCPERARGPLSLTLDLLAAVPSVVYGLWGVFVLIPTLLPTERWLASTFSSVPFVGGAATGPNLFIAALILAIMILPIVSAISREVLATVPASSREAALALGATRWEAIRLAILPHARTGIVGASMLGLGRALGETIAVTLVVGNSTRLPGELFGQGSTLAAVIANEFGEAANDPRHAGALVAAGLVLFVLTLAVNAIARAFVVGAERGPRMTAAPAMAGVSR